MAIDAVTPRTRRALLAASLGSLAAAAAGALGRPAPAAANHTGYVDAGGYNTTVTETRITNTSDGGVAFSAIASSTAIYGSSSAGVGVYGSGATYGVVGTSSYGRGVYAFSTSAAGVYAGSGAISLPAVIGQSLGGNAGLLGYSGPDPLPATPAKTGVYGHATQDSNSRGVYGRSLAGRGVYGAASSGLGVRGYASSGVGLSGAASTGYALRTDGRLRFDKSGGSATINAGQSSVTVSPGIDLTATTVVIATLQGNAGGSTGVERVAINTTANTFQIILTGTTTGAVKVGWLAFG